MPDSKFYESHLSREAVALITSLSTKRQRAVLDSADQIAKQPFQIGDYQTTDAVGRSIENLRLEGYLFSY